MSGGFTPGLRHTDYGVDGEASFLASEHGFFKRAGATFDASVVTADGDGNKILKAGTAVAKITANGKYGPVDAAATDGREAPDDDAGYLPVSINLKDGDVIDGVMLHGSVLEARVTPTPPPAAFVTAVQGRITFQ